MDKELISINHPKYGTVFFVYKNEKIFVIGSEIERLFKYRCIQGSSLEKQKKHRISGKVVSFNLNRTRYDFFLRDKYHSFCKKNSPCVYINDFLGFLKNSRPVSKVQKTRKAIIDFLGDVLGSFEMKKGMDAIYSGMNAEQKMTVYTSMFQEWRDNISGIENKFKSIMAEMDEQKKQIDAKDRSIFVLRDKIKELEEQNAQLKSQLEDQTKLNKVIGSFVQDWTALNNATV